MSARLPSHLLVGALLRRVNDAGGFGVVRAAGEAQSGAILALLDDADGVRAVERMLDMDGHATVVAAGPQHDSAALEGYWRRRRSRDPDLWVVEVSIADGERFVAETIASG